VADVVRFPLAHHLVFKVSGHSPVDKLGYLSGLALQRLAVSLYHRGNCALGLRIPHVCKTRLHNIATVRVREVLKAKEGLQNRDMEETEENEQAEEHDQELVVCGYSRPKFFHGILRTVDFLQHILRIFSNLLHVLILFCQLFNPLHGLPPSLLGTLEEPIVVVDHLVSYQTLPLFVVIFKFEITKHGKDFIDILVPERVQLVHQDFKDIWLVFVLV